MERLMTEQEREQLWCEGVRLFNAREFFACHDVLEEVWTETLGHERTFFHGMIHAAVALFHFSEGNLGGARKMYGSTTVYLQPFAPRHRDIRVDALLQDLRACFAELIAADAGYPTGLAVDDSLIPMVQRFEVVE